MSVTIAVVAVVGTVAAAAACVASVVCGVAAGIAIGVGIGIASGAATYAAENAGTRKFSWAALGTDAAIGGALGAIPGGGVVGGTRFAAARLLSRAIPMSSAAWKLDGWHRVGGWVLASVLTRSAIKPTLVRATGRLGLSISVHTIVNGKAGIQNWVVDRNYLVHSMFEAFRGIQ